MLHSFQKFNFLLFISFFLPLALVSCHPQINSSNTQIVHWRTLEAAKIEAFQRNMPVLVDFFYGSECMRCLAVQKDVYDDSEIINLIAKDFIPVRVWLSMEMSQQEEALSQKLNNNGECILAFLDAQGNVIKNVQGKDISSMGMLLANNYMQYMNEALEMIRHTK